VRILFDKDDDAVVDVRADPGRLVQVVTNLLSNAIKFSPADAEVELSVEKKSDFVRISVRDHGSGIAAEFKPRIFERFAQADATDARLRGGTGLGLSIVKQIVDRLGGKVSFADAPGGGTVFYVDLPCWQSETSVAIDSEAQLEALKQIHIELDRGTAAVRGEHNGLMRRQG
jgi:signal transduction histidine kinase